VNELRRKLTTPQDYIRKAVELADEWQTTRLGDQRIKAFAPHGEGGEHPLTDIGYLDQQCVLDALAAQLVRQVDVLSDYGVFTEPEQTHVWEVEPEPEILGGELYEGGKWWHSEGPDRTMNTIKAIVDSGVLARA